MPNKKKLLFSIFALLLILPACTNAAEKAEKLSDDISDTTNLNTDLMTTDELIIEDLKVGDGTEATDGSIISVHYVGTLTDGSQFDSSRDRGTPFQFTLGAGQVIKGWDEGFAGMKVGGIRKLTIPSDMAYGETGIPGAIPGGATLVFEVELLDVQ